MNTKTNWKNRESWLGIVCALVLLLIAFFPKLISAQGTGPDTMNYQGWLLDNNGDPRSNETHCMRFRLCSDSGCAAPVWPGSGYEYHTVTTGDGDYKGGLFNVTLGSVNPMPPTLMFDYDTLYLEVGVSDASSGCDGVGETYTVMEPRSQLRSNAYAQRSRRVNTEESDDTYLIQVTNTGAGGGISAQTRSASDDARAASFLAAGTTGQTHAVYAQNDSTGDGARAGFFDAQGDSGATYGVYTTIDSPEGVALYATGPTTGVVGIATDNTRVTRGVYGQVDSTADGAASGYFLAEGTSGQTYGLYAQNDSTSAGARAGFFDAQGDSGATYGVYTTIDSPEGVALYATGPTTGVVGIATDDARVTRGVYGQVDSTADGTAGGYFLAEGTSGQTHAVYAQNDSTSNGARAGEFVAAGTSGQTHAVYAQNDSTSNGARAGEFVAAGTSGQTHAVYAQNDSTTDGARAGEFVAAGASGQTHAVYAQNDSPSGDAGYFDSAGDGIVARTDSTIDDARAGSFTAAGTSGKTWGVFARNNSTSDNARAGDFWATGNSGATYGIYVENESSGDGAATGFFWANADSGATKAVWALNDSNGDNSRAGTFRSRGESGITYGVYADVDSPAGTAVYASAPVSAVVGIAGNNSLVTRGVYGEVDSTGDGAAAGYFHAKGGSGETYGLYARNDSSSGYAGYFDGNVYVNGTLAKSAGSFKIDHPLDPANRYLMHSFVESPDMKNIYDGIVQLDQNGEAWVQLPGYFQALNRDFRYQLTPIGGPGPGLYIASEIEDNRFQIAGGEAGLEVSWQVTGIRQDPYAEAYPIPVETMKPAEERGTYLHPELYE